MSQHVTTLFEATDARSSRARHGIARQVVLMYDAWRTRRLLAELDPALLKDIGISRAEADVEAARAPWDLGPRR